MILLRSCSGFREYLKMNIQMNCWFLEFSIRWLFDLSISYFLELLNYWFNYLRCKIVYSDNFNSIIVRNIHQSAVALTLPQVFASWWPKIVVWNEQSDDIMKFHQFHSTVSREVSQASYIEKFALVQEHSHPWNSNNSRIRKWVIILMLSIISWCQDIPQNCKLNFSN